MRKYRPNSHDNLLRPPLSSHYTSHYLVIPDATYNKSSMVRKYHFHMHKIYKDKYIHICIISLLYHYVFGSSQYNIKRKRKEKGMQSVHHTILLCSSDASPKINDIQLVHHAKLSCSSNVCS